MTDIECINIVLVMYMLQILVSLVALSGAALDAKKLPVNTTCPPGTAYDPPQHNCSCIPKSDDIVLCKYQCGEFEVGVLNGYCMTMNSKRSEVVVGSCLFRTQNSDMTHTIVPNNSSSWMEQSVAMLTELVSCVGSA